MDRAVSEESVIKSREPGDVSPDASVDRARAPRPSERTCIGCGERAEKGARAARDLGELIRLILGPDGEIAVDG